MHASNFDTVELLTYRFVRLVTAGFFGCVAEFHHLLTLQAEGLCCTAEQKEADAIIP